MADKQKKKNNAPLVPDRDIPDPTVPNRAHTEMSAKDDGETKEDPTIPEIPPRHLF